MKDLLDSLVRAAAPRQRGNVIREYLQARILESLQRSGAMLSLAFQGGTALRFLFGLPRYSDDLDFALERPEGYPGLRPWLEALDRTLALEGYRTEIKVSDRRPVHAALVRFPGLLFELGLSGRRAQVLSIKLEIDTRPPAGAVVATTLVRRHVLIRVVHHDQASLFAGKLHALLQRPHAKGRDVYDLLWYLGDASWPAPNLTMLGNALAQTGWAGPMPEPETWPALVAARIRALDFAAVVRDVEPFLERGADADLLTADNLVEMLARRRRG